MFATALNLLPGGQLDGGHIIFSLSPQLHRAVSFLTVLVLIPTGKYFWTGWLLWSVLLAMTLRHPPVPREPSVSGRRRLVALFGALMFILSFTPAPFTHSSGREVWPEIRQGARDSVRSLHDEVREWLHRK
jgi:membrane-associated protease RseP (regulator of RpoE activity)